jgi:hypothetical protein
MYSAAFCSVLMSSRIVNPPWPMTPRDTPRKLDMTVDGAELRRTDVDPNTHGSASLSDQQRNQVLAAYMMDLDRPAGSRVIGHGAFTILEDINTEQKAAEYIRAVAKSLEIP